MHFKLLSGPGNGQTRYKTSWSVFKSSTKIKNIKEIFERNILQTRPYRLMHWGEMRSVLFVVLEDKRWSDLCKLKYSWSEYWHISIQVRFVVWNIYWLMIWTGNYLVEKGTYIHFKTNTTCCLWCMYNVLTTTSCLLPDISALLCNILVWSTHIHTLYS